MLLVLIGGLILAADYSQLELRILAHLSRDRRLLQVLNSGEDVFKSIAAEWKMVDPKSVDDRMRQEAKQVRHRGKSWETLIAVLLCRG